MGRSIHEEILVEVMCRLPRKSCCRFKCVSKRWCNLISDPNLVIPKTTKAGLVVQSKPPNSDTVALTFLRVDNMGGASIDHFIRHNLNEKYRISNSCNGCLLLSHRFCKDGPMYLVFNPITKFLEHVVPPTRTHRVPHPHDLVTLVFDGKHLKVIFLPMTFKGSRFMFYVFSFEDKKWSQKESPPPLGGHFYFAVFSTQQLFFKGAVHWADIGYLHILHLEDGFCKAIPLPNMGADMYLWENSCIWVFEGRLHYCEVGVKREEFGGQPSDDEFRSNEPLIDIWILEIEENEYVPSSQQCFQWQHKHSGVLSLPTSVRNKLRPFAFNEDFEILYLKFKGSIISYNPKTRKQKVAYECPSNGESQRRCIYGTFPFLYLGD